MKKLVSTIMIIAIAISLVGCGKNFKSFESTGNYDDNAYPRFLSTDWGMTENEVFKALGIKREDIPTDKIYKEDGYASYEVEILFNKSPIKTSLIFEYGKNADVSNDLGLVEVCLPISTTQVNDAVKSIVTELELGVNDAYTIYEKKGLFEKRFEIEEKLFPLTEEIRATPTEWSDSLKMNLMHQLSSQSLVDVMIKDGRDENGEIPKEMPFGLAVFNGKNLAQIRLLDGK